ncbi:MAG: galactose-1-phosphate uridylyltransferase [Bryobacterales bacterium]|nr:galactose-1-phosphate uridylyltransferase [Bryobacteraceae bacterium]MDW8355146.1 galactose-1-phosphate uridylyltransferase [Bryobacterales bacterium]
MPRALSSSPAYAAHFREHRPVSELRWHPLLRQWVAITTHRQDRPQLPEDWCPFCPGSGRVPDRYDVYLYPNDFPAFSLEAASFAPEVAADSLFRSTGARGVCDVVLYHPNHTLLPSEMPVSHWRKVVDLWTARTAQLASIPDIAYVYVFENTGIAIGVTMPHPHGQIYGFPFVPPLPEAALAAARDHYQRRSQCLYCRILAEEQRVGTRIVFANDSFVAFVPFFARWPSEMQIYARRHLGWLPDLTAAEQQELAEIVSVVRRKYDNLYGFPIPLMMLLRQRPVRGDHAYFHFHIEFYPIQRSATKLKYLAGVESGCGTFLNDTLPEEEARRLRAAAPPS